MARWKARVEFLLSVMELLFLSLTTEVLQGKMCQNSLPSGGSRSLGAKISGGRGRPWGIFLVFAKLDTFCYPTLETAPCYAVVLTQYRRVTDRRTDVGIPVDSTGLAMPALRHAVKKRQFFLHL